jgi:hypothetical protein
MDKETASVPNLKHAVMAPSEQKGALLINPGAPVPPTPPPTGTQPIEGGLFLVNPGTPSAPSPPDTSD